MKRGGRAARSPVVTMSLFCAVGHQDGWFSAVNQGVFSVWVEIGGVKAAEEQLGA